jgi:hypothetical protein
MMVSLITNGDDLDIEELSHYLTDGTLRCAAIETGTGALVAVPAQAWRRGEWRGETHVYAIQAAAEGAEILISPEPPYTRGRAIVSLHDLAQLMNFSPIPPLPREVPAEWVTNSRAVADQSGSYPAAAK